MSTAADDITRLRAWLIATRPHTLPAAGAPVIVGAGLAVHEGVFSPLPTAAALVGAMLIQVGTNLANDYYDAVTGVDAQQTAGYTRVTQTGLIAPGRVRAGMVTAFGLAVLIGTYLVIVGGLPILAIGLGGIASGWAYAGGPYPLGSYGLGDLFVFVWFGIIAVTGTFYVQAAAMAPTSGIIVGQVPLYVFPPNGTVSAAVIVASLPAASLSTAILVVNNLRDLADDRTAGKYTLAVIIGERWTRVEYLVLVYIAYGIPIVLWQWYEFGPAILLPLGTIPYAVEQARAVFRDTAEETLNPALEGTGRLLFGHSVLFAIGMVV